jgi:uncharacterized membrane protein YidH (DUF202 family)
VTVGAHRDPGAFVETQAERTELAWVRTVLAAAGLAAVAVRLSGRDFGLGFALVLGTLVAVPGLFAAWWRVGSLREPEPAPPRQAAVAVLAGTVAAVDALVLALVVL